MPTIPKLKDVKHDTPQPTRIILSEDYYNKSTWRRLRNFYIRMHPLCERCLNEDRITAATEVHHIQPFMSGITEEQRIGLLLDVDNLMSVCRECHMDIHKRMLTKTNSQ